MTQILKKKKRLCDLVSGEQNTLPICGVTSDSRKVEAGFLFAAFTGKFLDGSAFILSAIKAGACAIVCATDTVLPKEAEKIAVIRSDNPRQLFSQIAARFYDSQPDTIVGVTGTNGKTSVVHFCRQIWAIMGKNSASLGTTGVQDAKGVFEYVRTNYLTTPDPATLHSILAKLTHTGVTHLAMEASSHGLDQYRLDGVRFQAVAFTNLTRDHLDYHHTEEAYFKAKSRLFEELVQPGGTVVLNADVVHFDSLKAIADKRGLKVMSFGHKGKDTQLVSSVAKGTHQTVVFKVQDQKHTVTLPLPGEFQTSNVLCALGLVIATGSDPEQAIAALKKIQPVPGRMERVSVRGVKNVEVFVDYAHTPDALETALKVLRPHTEGKLWVVFGCGGDRDKGKRPMMGKVAAECTDYAIVTDDNPRSENPAVIRGEVLKACRGGREIGDRKEAIYFAVSSLQEGDVLLIAGKGHEKTQVIGLEVHPFDDVQVAADAMKERK